MGQLYYRRFKLVNQKTKSHFTEQKSQYTNAYLLTTEERYLKCYLPPLQCSSELD